MKYKEQSVPLEKGDIVYLYTDGVTEAEDKGHALFGEERLLRCLENRSGSSAAQILALVKEAVDRFIKGNSQFDDMTMLCFRWKPE